MPRYRPARDGSAGGHAIITIPGKANIPTDVSSSQTETRALQPFNLGQVMTRPRPWRRLKPSTARLKMLSLHSKPHSRNSQRKQFSGLIF